MAITWKYQQGQTSRTLVTRELRVMECKYRSAHCVVMTEQWYYLNGWRVATGQSQQRTSLMGKVSATRWSLSKMMTMFSSNSVPQKTVDMIKIFCSNSSSSRQKNFTIIISHPSLHMELSSTDIVQYSPILKLGATVLAHVKSRGNTMYTGNATPRHTSPSPIWMFWISEAEMQYKMNKFWV